MADLEAVITVAWRRAQSKMLTNKRARDAAKRRRQYYRRIAEGRCCDCGKPPEAGYKRCRACLDRQNAATLAWRNRRIAAGIPWRIRKPGQ